MDAQKTINRAAILLINFNLPELTDALVEQIRRNIQFPHELFLLDNGSEDGKASRYATHTVSPNIGLNGGLNYLWSEVRDRSEFDAYWFLCNDIVLDEGTDYLDKMAALYASLSERYKVACITPSYHYEGMGAVPETMKKREGGGWRPIVWMEWNACLLTRDFMLDLFPDGLQTSTKHGFQDVIFNYEGWMHGYGSFLMEDLPIKHIGNQTFLKHGGSTVNGVFVPDYEGLKAMLVNDMKIVEEEYARRGVDFLRTRELLHQDIDEKGDFEKYLLDGYRPEVRGKLTSTVQRTWRRVLGAAARS